MTNEHDPAFTDRYPSLTKREHFAAMAMQGLVAASVGEYGYPTWRFDYETGLPKHADETIREIATVSVKLATALTDALNVEQSATVGTGSGR